MQLTDNRAYQLSMDEREEQADLILKGGVTSGIVYPPLICELATRFRFREVGGTSAGAIAAAAAAAAEYGRESPRPGAGFAGLRAMQHELGQPGNGRQPGFLLGLFQPAPEARQLMEVLLTARRVMGKQGEVKGARGWLRLLARLRRTLEEQGLSAGPRKRGPLTALGASTAGALALSLWQAGSRSRRVTQRVASLSQALPAVVLLAALQARKLYQALGGGKLRDSFTYVLDKDRSLYGLCTGLGAGNGKATADGRPALTDWLHERLQQLSGLGEGQLLTLGVLRHKGREQGREEDHSIHFQMVTTNLGHRQPYILRADNGVPPPRSEHERRRRAQGAYAFKRSDMEKLFPRPVVEYLVRWGEARSFAGVKLPEGYYHFPLGDDLPVLVATRMSLSFPVLLSAVRLYTLKPSVLEEGGRWDEAQPPQLDEAELDENWFSDGGIASNFPIHMFDAWVPSRPTFGVTLEDSQLPEYGMQPGRPFWHPSTQGGQGYEPVYLPWPAELPLFRVEPLPSLGSFLLSIFDTAQNFRDTSQARLPSYRERVALVRLESNEGGLNLDMPREVIQQVEAKGEQAAALLKEKFDFDHHRWVRLMLLMARIERELHRIQQSYAWVAEQRKRDGKDWKEEMRQHYRELLEKQLEAARRGAPWYGARDEAWCREAEAWVEGLVEMIDGWEQRREEWRRRGGTVDEGFFFEDFFPEGILRITPEQ
jgi:predicted acylesterase/phospholipase RssA